MAEITWEQPSPPLPPPVIEFFYLNPDRPTQPSHVRWETGQWPPMILEVDWRFWRQGFEQIWEGDEYMKLAGSDGALKLSVTGDFDKYTLVELRHMSDQIKRLE